ncbi:MAG: hypothetical protein ACE5HI_11850 [bacterium]
MSKPLFGQIFLPDDPIWDDPDQLNMPAPAEAMHSEYYDFYENTFLFPGKENDGPAQNVNSLGEVPNSAWYTNRHYLHPMSMAELLRGPDQGSGPAMTGKWEIIAGKTQGITPGFTIKDAKSDLYLIKFDPPGNPEMSTGAEMISTKLFYALGYSTPENYLINLHLGQLVLSPEATSSTPLGKTRPLTQEMVDEMLAMAHKDKSGHYRVLASKLLQGKPLGPFRYYGTRPDDANDIFPHGSRRELRGLRIFCAWLNHDDSRSINTLDMLVTEDNRQFVRHYLIDFGSTLGSGSVFAQDPRAGNEYILESKPAIRSFLSFGFWVRPWAKVHYPDYPAIGRLEGDFFDPQKWKPEYPNPAFLNCDAEDAFWAARQVMNFSDQEIRAIVSLAQYSNPEAENYMVETLIKRRDKIGKAYLRFSGGLDKFRIEAGKWLVFEDLLSKYNLAKLQKTRKITWRVFDNATGETGRTLTENESKDVKIPIPSFESEFVVSTIETPGVGIIQVFIRNSSQGLKIVGIKRK